MAGRELEAIWVRIGTFEILRLDYGAEKILEFTSPDPNPNPTPQPALWAQNSLGQLYGRQKACGRDFGIHRHRL